MTGQDAVRDCNQAAILSLISLLLLVVEDFRGTLSGREVRIKPSRGRRQEHQSQPIRRPKKSRNQVWKETKVIKARETRETRRDEKTTYLRLCLCLQS